MTWIIFPIGIIIILIGFLFHRKHKNLQRVCTKQTAGEVIRMERREEVEAEKDSDGFVTVRRSVMFYPVFQYTAGERSMEKVSTTGSSRPQFHEGQSVTVMYAPGNPEKFYVAEDKAAARFGIYFMAFGAAVAILGIVMLIVL